MLQFAGERHFFKYFEVGRFYCPEDDAWQRSYFFIIDSPNFESEIIHTLKIPMQSEEIAS